MKLQEESARRNLSDGFRQLLCMSFSHPSNYTGDECQTGKIYVFKVWMEEEL